MRDNVETLDAFLERMASGDAQHKQKIKIKKLNRKLKVKKNWQRLIIRV